MKNFKKLALGLIIGAMAIGFSAFTASSNKSLVKHHRAAKAGMITDDFIVQPSLNSFQEQPSVNTANCHSTATRECVYDVTSTGKSNIPDQASYSASDIDTYVANGWLAADPGSSPALY